MCVKGQTSQELLYHPDRLRYPLRRCGDRFQRVTWEEALDVTAERLAEIQHRHGRAAVGVYGGGSEAANVQVVLTNRISGVSGSVKANGQPVTAASVVLFPEDQAQWVFPSRRVRTMRVDQTGVFRATAVPPGERYLAVAVDYLEQGEFQDPVFLERMRGRATAFSLSEGENKNLDLTLVER